jgi:FkbM family methyltransferase
MRRVTKGAIRSLALYRKSLLERDIRFRMKRLISGSSAQVKVQGSIMELDLRDNGISKELLLDGVRERESTELLKGIVREGDVVVDIGSNIGYYALMESILVGHPGMVYAIEPVRRNFISLTKNISLNGYKNIKAYQLAIGDKQEKVDMNISKKCNWNTIIKTDKIELTGITETVEVTKLDKFLSILRKPNFVRMDVEGYEINILKGMNRTLKLRTLKNIFIEFHPHIMGKEKTLHCLDILDSNGFNVQRAIKSWTTPQYVSKGNPPEYPFYSTRDLASSEDFISGKLGAFEIFFRRAE